MVETSAEPLLGDGGDKWNLRSTFATSSSILVGVLLVLLSLFGTYEKGPHASETVVQYYMYYIHVAIMVFVGFGFLMTFLRRYSYSAVGLNFYLSCLCMLEYIVLGGAFQQGLLSGKTSSIILNLPLMIDSAFCAAAAMITFGALIGKVAPAQILWVLALEVPVYVLNVWLAVDVLGCLDMGGSVTIHAFGAYYGLGAALAVSTPGAGSSHPKNGASYYSDITAMIGTIFLWIFWPSFNGALASSPVHGLEDQQFYCVVNTVVSLTGACLVAFTVSSLVENKLNMVHVQNATLAGGVAIGSSANFAMSPGAALLVGLAAGALSTLGYCFIMPALEKAIKLQDTCGVHNLHGMPGLFGGLVAAAVSVFTASDNKALLPLGTATWWHQVFAVCTTLIIALGAGSFAGWIVGRAPTPFSKQKLAIEDMYEDSMYWGEVEPEGELPTTI